MSRKAGKNITKSRGAIEKRQYLLSDAVPLLQKVKFAKFDETVEVTLRLGVDPKHADQMVRGTVVLPHGLGKLYFLEQRHSITQKILALLNCPARLRYVLSCFATHFSFSLSPTASGSSPQP